jgi:hypothetical protein
MALNRARKLSALIMASLSISASQAVGYQSECSTLQNWISFLRLSSQGQAIV